jgi:GGDEF domain-containing protein
VRPYDQIIRLGRDEFLCVMSNLTLEAARKRIDALAAALNRAPSADAIRTGFAQLRDDETAGGLIAPADSELILRPR